MRTMVGRCWPLTLVLFAALMVGGCRGLMGAFHEEVTGSPAPTTVPLPSSTAAPEAQPAQPSRPGPAVTSPPTGVGGLPTTPAAQVEPTRAIPPADTLSLPPGFGISIFAQGLRDPRMMALGPDGQLYVAERGAGRIVRLPDRDGDGVADSVEVVAEGLDAPSSMAFYQDGSLYAGETKRVLRLSAPDTADEYIRGAFQEREVILDGLPSGGHATRTVLFSPDWSSLFVSIGSSCNVCVEEDPRRATIMRYNPDGSGGQVYAQGLRNAVGITFRPGTVELWATNNGRDWLGDDQPPETVYHVREGDNAGWPYCHSGRIVDPDYGGPTACEGVVAPAVEMQAHSAPLGLTFYSGTQFPEEYQGDLFVAFHGSWNRAVPTGYKVVRIPLQDGQAGQVQDFATGWLRANGSQWGRPVDVLTGGDGSLFVSDDSGGSIYRIFYAGG
ncbi:MAG TPA: sorbosone dehydrogenase family protein, partial [Anaerolineae bacterium]|nr:sorbosone dehydrogenase family protein [Anaerolineae bacterium]